MTFTIALQFICFNILNVVIQTFKSIATIRCGKTMAAVVNAIAYGLYTYIIILTTIDIPLWFKIIVVALANLIGVYIVKLIEEKREKEKLWKIEMAVPHNRTGWVRVKLTEADIPHNFVTVGQYTMFNCYCYTKSDTSKVKDIGKEVEAKFSAFESKSL